MPAEAGIVLLELLSDLVRLGYPPYCANNVNSLHNIRILFSLVVEDVKIVSVPDSLHEKILFGKVTVIIQYKPT